MIVSGRSYGTIGTFIVCNCDATFLTTEQYPDYASSTITLNKECRSTPTNYGSDINIVATKPAADDSDIDVTISWTINNPYGYINNALLGVVLYIDSVQMLDH